MISILGRDQLFDITPGDDLCAGTLIGIIAAVHDATSNLKFLARVFQACREALKASEKIFSRRGAGFDMDNLSIQLTN
jgi:hypothetical protein